MISRTLQSFVANIQLPAPDSHKGQNGKLLIIGGSELFHAASKWSLDIASKFVDMVFYSSVPSNNQLIAEAKGQFWNGIVIPRDQLPNYIEEADCILIGPGMERAEETAQVVNDLVSRYRHRRWVIDAGALQMMDTALLSPEHIITPHFKELQRIVPEISQAQTAAENLNWPELWQQLNQATILLKGPTDFVMGERGPIEVAGGNAGMTKGGTGDVLAGLVAALYCHHQHDAMTAAVVASLANKKAGEALYQQVGTFFNASDLVEVIPQVVWQLL